MNGSMTIKLSIMASILVGVVSSSVVSRVNAAPFVQCRGDTDGDAIVDVAAGNENVKCMHLAAGDGFIKMADGKLQYMFGFSDMTGIPAADAIGAGILRAAFPAPSIVLDEDDEFYLTLTNVGMIMRPDLADPHTVHFHGFPNASSIFDGVPDASISVQMGASLSYYYNISEPGTYMYHCHVEATEHMQMGMLGNLYVKPKQNKSIIGTILGTHVHSLGDQYVYNDGDASTLYDVEFPIQIGSFDPEFHDASMNVQPLPFAEMKDKYPMLNGRGYPDTKNPAALIPPPESAVPHATIPGPQVVSSLITATVGEKVLLRISNLNITNNYTLVTNGLKMKVVGEGARLYRGPDGKDLYYETNSVTLGGGESIDVIIDTTGVPLGTYFLYTANLNYLNNNEDDFGGMMTEIHIN